MNKYRKNHIISSTILANDWNKSTLSKLSLKTTIYKVINLFVLLFLVIIILMLD